MKTIDGFLVLSKRQPGADEGGDVLIPPAAIVAIEPHRHGCYVYVAGSRWDVAHAQAEIVQAVALSGLRFEPALPWSFSGTRTPAHHS